jgi:hypothetical protein
MNQNEAIEFLDNGLPVRPSDLVFKGHGRRLNPRLSYASLEELEGADRFTFHALRKVFVALVLYYKKASIDNKNSLFNRTSQKEKPCKTFDRTLTVMCLNSKPGMNTALILLNSERADILFGQHLEGRDSSDGFGPYAIIAVQRPNPTENYFGDRTGIPVLNFQCGMQLVDMAKSKISLKVIKPDPQQGRLHGFFFPNVHLTLMNCNVAHTNCCGFLCDSVGMKRTDGTWERHCPCYSVKRTIGYVLFDLNLRAVVKDCDEHLEKQAFFIQDFTSRRFTDLATKSGIPLSVNTNTLQARGADHEIAYRLEKFLEHVNQKHGGFTLLGWNRRGRLNVTNPSVDQKGNGTTEPSVAAADVRYHVTHIGINCSSTALSKYRIDVQGLLNGVDENTSGKPEDTDDEDGSGKTDDGGEGDGSGKTDDGADGEGSGEIQQGGELCANGKAPESQTVGKGHEVV